MTQKRDNCHEYMEVIGIFLTPQERTNFAGENKALVYYVANMFISSGVTYDELVSIATLGFAKALNGFDMENGAKFSTYAIRCMRNEILYFLRKERKHQMNVSLNKVLSTDKNGNDLSLEQTLESDQDSIEDMTVNDERYTYLWKALEELSENERYVAIYRYGLDRGIIKTQTEIAEEIKMSQANVSKIENAIKDKLKVILVKKFKVTS